MDVEFRIEGDSLDDLESKARTQCAEMAEGREFTFALERVSLSTDRDYPHPTMRIAAGYARPTFSTYVTASFADRAT